MSFNLVHIFQEMSMLSKGILAVLVVMAVSFIAVTIERMITFSRSAKESRKFAQAAAKLLEDWKIEEIAPLAEKHKTSALARLFGAITRRYVDGHADLGGGLTPVQLAKNEAERRKDQVAEELRRGLSVLATVGSIAPFVGLLGTVVGIIAAFQGIGATGSGGIAAVSTGIAEALVETAFGLMVAIPAVILFNYLTTRINGIEAALGRSASELLDELENHHGRAAESPAHPPPPESSVGGSPPPKPPDASRFAPSALASLAMAPTGSGDAE
jgi:biopolymer transport protein ExbB